jgi:primosomal protein DnaI
MNFNEVNNRIRLLDKQISDLSEEELGVYKNHPLVTKLNLTDDEFKKHFGIIKRMVDQQNACDQLLDRCVNSSNYHIVLAREGTNLVTKSVYCSKMKKLNEKTGFIKNFLYRSFPNEFLDRTLSKQYFKIALDPSLNKLVTTFNKIIKGEKDLDGGYYIYGSFGIGKTYICQTFANDLARNNKTVAFCFLPDFVYNLKQGFNDPDINQRNQKIINDFIRADVLFLDDIGAEETNKWFYAEYLMVILNARVQLNKPTILISNLSFADLEKKMIKICGSVSGNRLCQRIIETTKNRIIKVSGENLRTKTK